MTRKHRDSGIKHMPHKLRTVVCPRCGGVWHSGGTKQPPFYALDVPPGAVTKLLAEKAVDAMELCMCPWVE
ncbi:MAG: hypothetical protein ABFE13_11535 [Phycisphaerales bacterium]